MVKHQCRMESNEGKMTPIQVPTKLDIIIDDNDFTSLFYNTNFNLQNVSLLQIKFSLFLTMFYYRLLTLIVFRLRET